MRPASPAPPRLNRISVKYLPAYLDEHAFRFNNRRNPFMFRDTVLKLIAVNALPFGDLVESKLTSRSENPLQANSAMHISKPINHAIKSVQERHLARAVVEDGPRHRSLALKIDPNSVKQRLDVIFGLGSQRV